jgi:trehalose 6-phosphate synthase/phosphatase
MGWIPVHYFYRSFSFEEIAALYNVADIALVTPLRDGMNLVAKEYLAAKSDRPGVLILSEMAGAAVELTDAVIVNPTDKKDIENALLKALAMPEEKQFAALRKMQRNIRRHTVQRWAGNFLADLHMMKQRNSVLDAKIVENETLRHIAAEYARAEKRLLILDYDGTLVSFGRDPAQARPTPALLEILSSLAADPRNTVAVCSGRDRETLEAWLGGLDILLAAEHGAFFKENGLWHGESPDMPWKDEILGILERFTDTTPRSEIEVKTTALVWHYRQVDPWFAALRVNQLMHALIPACGRAGLQIIRGNKIVEIKPANFNKGTEARRLLEKASYDFILAIGDDVTDEDMFAALPAEAVTIKVGQFSDAARYSILVQHRVPAFLALLAAAGV